MDTAKIEELIAELEADIRIRQEAVNGLAKLLRASSPPNQVVKPSDQMNLQDVTARPILFAASDSYVDLAIKVITANDYKPMRMNDIVTRIRVLKNNQDIQRRSVESTLVTHAKKKGDHSLVVRVGRGVWGVRRFPHENAINY